VFAAIDRMRGMVQPKMGRQKAVTARRTTEWRDKDKEGKVLAWRLRIRSQEAILPASRTTQDATHIFCSFSFPRANVPISSPPIDDLLLSVKKTKVPCESRIEKNEGFIGKLHHLHICLWKPRPGTKLKRLYREADELDARGVIRLTRGRTDRARSLRQ
jgi:hypothetical protein